MQIAKQGYQKLDQLASDMGDAAKTRFQSYFENVQNAQSAVDGSPKPTDAQIENLNNAQAQLKAYVGTLEDKGLQNLADASDAAYTKGKSMLETARKFALGEFADGTPKPNAATTWNTQVRNLSNPAATRGHVLGQALSDDAGEVTDAVTNAQQQIAARTAEQQAAKQTVKNTTQAKADAEAQIDRVIKNRWNTAKVLGGGSIAGGTVYGLGKILGGR